MMQLIKPLYTDDQIKMFTEAYGVSPERFRFVFTDMFDIIKFANQFYPHHMYFDKSLKEMIAEDKGPMVSKLVEEINKASVDDITINEGAQNGKRKSFFVRLFRRSYDDRLGLWVEDKTGTVKRPFAACKDGDETQITHLPTGLSVCSFWYINAKQRDKILNKLSSESGHMETTEYDKETYDKLQELITMLREQYRKGEL